MYGMKSSFAILAAAGLAAGCAPDRPDADPRPAGEMQMAVLTSGDGGGWDIAIMDAAGNVSEMVDADLAQPVSFEYHMDGFFLVSDGSNIHRVELDGDVTRFNQAAMPSVVYRMNVTDDGDVDVAEEYDSVRLDDEGNIVEHSVVNGQYCWMDAVDNGEGGTAMLDVFGPTLANWNAEEDSFEPIAVGVGSGTNIVGRDGSGRFYAASNYGQQIWAVEEDGEVEALGTLSSMGIEAWAVKAIEPASASSVFVLYEGNEGSGIVELQRGGSVRDVIVADSAVWLDLTVF